MPELPVTPPAKTRIPVVHEFAYPRVVPIFVAGQTPAPTREGEAPLMPAPAVVLAAIDAAPALRDRDEVLFARMANAGAHAGQLVEEHVRLALGLASRFTAHLDGDGTARRAKRRHVANRAARRARRNNR